MKEIGSYLELDLRNTGELFDGPNVCRLNTNRAGIYHCCRLYGVNKVYVPYYECSTVRDFLMKKGIEVVYYSIDWHFVPEPFEQENGTAVIVVNYFGIMSEKHIKETVRRFKNVIIDNAQALYARPNMNALNVYSPRKFIGVPDGGYVVGYDVNRFSEEYSEDKSSETCDFLLKRHEIGGSAAYADRMKNEERIDASDIHTMSPLSLAILKNAPYRSIKSKRRKNFDLACKLYDSFNTIDPREYYDIDCVPFVYPLVVEDKNLVQKLAQEKIYTGRWWNYLLKETPKDSFEHYMSTYMVPIPIDQRYGKEELQYVKTVVERLKK